MLCTLCTLKAHLHSIPPPKMLRTWIILINAQEKPICTSLSYFPCLSMLFCYSHFLPALLQSTIQVAYSNIQTCTVRQGCGPLAEREVAPWAGLALKLPRLVLVECHRAQCTAADIVELAQPTGSCNQSPRGHY